MLESDEYEMEFICSEYKTATDEVNNQIDEIQKIVKGYSPESMVIGEAPLTKDLTGCHRCRLKDSKYSFYPGDLYHHYDCIQINFPAVYLGCGY